MCASYASQSHGEAHPYQWHSLPLYPSQQKHQKVSDAAAAKMPTMRITKPILDTKAMFTCTAVTLPIVDINKHAQWVLLAYGQRGTHALVNVQRLSASGYAYHQM